MRRLEFKTRHLNDGVIPDGMELAMTLDSYADRPKLYSFSSFSN